MKTKAIILTLSMLFGIMGARAQEWRGFIEIYGGTSPIKSNFNLDSDEVHNMWNSLSFGLDYTMGVAVLPQLFAGVGIGGYTSLLKYPGSYDYEEEYSNYTFPALYFPVFANLRWIPDVSKKINPFVDLKIGYQMGVDLVENRIWLGSGSRWNTDAQHKNGLFLQPGVGVRFGRESAFNLGLAYNICQRIEFVAYDSYNNVVDSKTKNFGSIMITFGADF